MGRELQPLKTTVCSALSGAYFSMMTQCSKGGFIFVHFP